MHIYIYINIYIYVHATVVYRIIQENRSFAGSGSTCRAQGGVAGATTGVISMKYGVWEGGASPPSKTKLELGSTISLTDSKWWLKHLRTVPGAFEGVGAGSLSINFCSSDGKVFCGGGCRNTSGMEEGLATKGLAIPCNSAGSGR